MHQVKCFAGYGGDIIGPFFGERPTARTPAKGGERGAKGGGGGGKA